MISMSPMTPNFVEAMDDPKWFGRTFRRRVFGSDTWSAWRSCGAAIFGLEMTPEQRDIYTKCTGRTDIPTEQASEAHLIIGRRGGKTEDAAAVAVYLACARDYSQVLAPGETGTIMLLGADRKQCQTILGYINALLDAPALKPRVKERLKESITLDGNIVIEVHTASYRSVRGYTVLACVCDELAFWRTEDGSANPDREILNALRPAMSTIPGSLLLCISSPYSRRGVLFDTYQRYYARAGAPVLIWQASTAVMNPTVPEAVIQRRYDEDPESARAEYGAEFRSDLSNFISLETVESCRMRGRYQLAPLTGQNYFGFCDPSGGASDSFTMAIAHAENGRSVLDLVVEKKPPFSPENVVQEFAATLKLYHVHQIIGDRYAGMWPVEQFAKRGITYTPSELTRSDLYLELLPLLTSSTVELLDNPRLITQLVSLERRVARSGRDSIDHAPGSHDDLANAAAGALVLALSNVAADGYVEFMKRYQADPSILDKKPAWLERKVLGPLKSAVKAVLMIPSDDGTPPPTTTTTTTASAESWPSTRCPYCGLFTLPAVRNNGPCFCSACRRDVNLFAPPEPCPQCSSRCVVWVGGHYQCNSCANSWGGTPVEVPRWNRHVVIERGFQLHRH